MGEVQSHESIYSFVKLYLKIFIIIGNYLIFSDNWYFNRKRKVAFNYIVGCFVRFLQLHIYNKDNFY